MIAYIVMAVIVGLVCAVVIAIGFIDDMEDEFGIVVCGVIVGLIGGAIAGVLWPATVVISSISAFVYLIMNRPDSRNSRPTSYYSPPPASKKHSSYPEPLSMFKRKSN